MNRGRSACPGGAAYAARRRGETSGSSLHWSLYILLGETDERKTSAYIGESGDIGERIRTHDAKLDWWTSAILVTSAANNLHKAHVKYLEARLVEEARKANQFLLENGNTTPAVVPVRGSIDQHGAISGTYPSGASRHSRRRLFIKDATTTSNRRDAEAD